MLARRSMLDSLKKKTGILHEIGPDVLEFCREQSRDSNIWFRYKPSNPVSQGWYMLSVVGIKETLGHDFQIHLPLQESNESTYHLQIGSKTYSKRIVRLAADTPWLEFNIYPGCNTKAAIRLTMVRLTEKFALSRMQKKITYSSVEGSVPARSDSLGTELFSRYNRLLERHVNKINYKEWRELRGEISSIKASGLTGGKFTANDYLDNTFGLVFTSPAIRVPEAARSLDSLPLAVKGRCHLLMNTSSDVTQIENIKGIAKLTNGGELNECAWFDSAVSKLDVDYLIFIGDGVVLQEQALSRLLSARSPKDNLLLAYPDSDIRDGDGERAEPSFKPEWNPEMLMCGNYIGRFFLIKKNLTDAAGGVNSSFGNSVEYDLLLRSISSLSSSTVQRIPEVLYGRTRLSINATHYLDAGTHDAPAMHKYLLSQGGHGQVSNGIMEGTIRVSWRVTQPEPQVDIIIPTRDHISLLDCCLKSIIKDTEYSNYRISIVDNNSEKAESIKYFEKAQQKYNCNILSYPGEFNYSAINNFAVSQTGGKIVVLLNNDTEVIDGDWLENLVAQCLRPSVGCVGAKLYYSSGLIQHAGVIIGVKGVAGHSHRFSEQDADGYCGRLKISQNVSAVTAACLAVRRDVYNEVGGMDEVNLKVAYNDVDFCLRVQEAGYQNVWTPFVELYHHESVSRGSDDTSAKAQRFQSEYDYMKSRWRTHELSDPAYNPNLALDLEDFSLAA